MHGGTRASASNPHLSVCAGEALAHYLPLQCPLLIRAEQLCKVLGQARLALLVDQQQELDGHRAQQRPSLPALLLLLLLLCAAFCLLCGVGLEH